MRMKLGISGQALGEVMSFADIVKLGKKYGVTEYEIWPLQRRRGLGLQGGQPG